MKTTKQLVLVFKDERGDDYNLRINNPKTGLDSATVLFQANAIIQANVILTKGSELREVAGAYIREVVVTNMMD